jgi:hypothetical protein
LCFLSWPAYLSIRRSVLTSHHIYYSIFMNKDIKFRCRQCCTQLPYLHSVPDTTYIAKRLFLHKKVPYRTHRRIISRMRTLVTCCRMQPRPRPIAKGCSNKPPYVFVVAA